MAASVRARATQMAADNNPLLHPALTASARPNPVIRDLSERLPWRCCDVAACAELQHVWHPRPRAPARRICRLESGSGANASVFLGVMSGPKHAARRDGLRNSWLRWVNDATVMDACFVVGVGGGGPRMSDALKDEEAKHKDLMLLRGFKDGVTPAITIAKAHAFWRAASKLLAHNSLLRFIGKVDDDSFVHVPRLLSAALLGMGCSRNIYFGAMAFTGYVAPRFEKCGFSWWQPSDDHSKAWSRHRCGQAGAVPPFPFAVGQLELLSSAVVQHLAASDDFADFARVSAMKNRNAQDEDVALGYVLSRSDLDVEYVGSNGRNSPYQMHNLRCSMGSAGLYRPPSDKSMVIHHVTDPAAMRYLWRVFVDGAKHEPPTCEQAMAGVSSEHASSKTLCDASCEQAIRALRTSMQEPRMSQHTNRTVCEAEVKSPIDAPPIRSPQVVHSLVALKSVGKELLEIGTRNGDGMACFALSAQKAIAIEYDEKYCRQLRNLSTAIEAQHPGKSFQVTCSDFRKGGVLDADIITWWEMGPALLNLPALLHLSKEQKEGRLRASAEAILLFDLKWKDDLKSWHAVCLMSSWSALVPFDEKERCLKNNGGRNPRNANTCNRAAGHFIVAGIPVRRVEAWLSRGSGLSSSNVSEMRARCHSEHEAGWARSVPSDANPWREFRAAT